MEDMERYGDYNEIDESPEKKKNTVLTVLKIAVFVALFAIIGILGFRIYVFNYYPDDIKNIYFTEKLLEYYGETDGNIGAKTQVMKTGYDDPDHGKFFCDNLIIVEGAGALQVSVRYNKSALEDIKEELGLEELSEDDPDILSFRLLRDPLTEGSEDEVIGYLAAEPITDSMLMYNYYKLAFEGVEFLDNEWIVLEIFVKGQTGTEPYAKVLIYQNEPSYNSFKEYKLSSDERPE